MTPPFLLNTSALLTHYRVELGHEVVGDILERHSDGVFTSAITWLEFQVRLKEITPDARARAEVLEIYQELIANWLPVTSTTAELAFEIREATPTRLPNSDVLIAATAKEKGVTSIHRDPHYLPIPPKILTRISLPEK